MPLGKWRWNEVTYIGIGFWYFVLSYGVYCYFVVEVSHLDQLKGRGNKIKLVGERCRLQFAYLLCLAAFACSCVMY